MQKINSKQIKSLYKNNTSRLNDPQSTPEELSQSKLFNTEDSNLKTHSRTVIVASKEHGQSSELPAINNTQRSISLKKSQNSGHHEKSKEYNSSRPSVSNPKRAYDHASSILEQFELRKELRKEIKKCKIECNNLVEELKKLTTKISKLSEKQIKHQAELQKKEVEKDNNSENTHILEACEDIAYFLKRANLKIRSLTLEKAGFQKDLKTKIQELKELDYREKESNRLPVIIKTDKKNTSNTKSISSTKSISKGITLEEINHSGKIKTTDNNLLSFRSKKELIRANPYSLKRTESNMPEPSPIKRKGLWAELSVKPAIKDKLTKSLAKYEAQHKSQLFSTKIPPYDSKTMHLREEKNDTKQFIRDMEEQLAELKHNTRHSKHNSEARFSVDKSLPSNEIGAYLGNEKRVEIEQDTQTLKAILEKMPLTKTFREILSKIEKIKR